MTTLRLAGTLLALMLFGTALQAAPNDAPAAREAKPPARESCQPSCVTMRVSTRCTCSLGKTLPAVLIT